METGEFRWVEDVLAPDLGGGDHLDNLVIARMLYDAWSHYLEARAPDTHGTRPTVRSITVRYDREVLPGDELRCGVRCASRSRRAFTLEQSLWRPVPRSSVATLPVAFGTVVLVAVSASSGQPVEIPNRYWDQIEQAEGRNIPPA